MAAAAAASPGLDCPPGLQRRLWAQLAALRQAQAAPFEALVADYAACLQHGRELEVRAGVLGKEAAELRDELAALQARLAGVDEAAARDVAAKADAYRAELQRANAELTSLLRDKSRAYEELLALRGQVDALRAAKAEADEAAELAAAEIAGLKARLAELSAALDGERAARALAAGEAAARVGAREAAEREAERLRADNLQLDAALKRLVAREAERLEQIGRMHEELAGNARRQQTEAGAASQLLGLLTRRRSSASSASATAAAAAAVAAEQQAAAGAASRRSSQTDAQAAATAAAAAAAAEAPSQQQQQPQLVYATLKQRLGLPDAPTAPLKERQLPAAPVRSLQAHSGGATGGLAFQRPGHLVATCGLDRTVQTWDLSAGAQHATTFQGLLGTANDAAFTADGRRLLGAGSDKRLLLWGAATGQVAHTLTGHTAPVSCVAASPLDEACAASAGEDRVIKAWDLNRGYCARSLPCAKMPTALVMSADGATLATGHMDGSLCLWDLRQRGGGGGGGQPIAEVRDHPAGVLSLTRAAHPDQLLTAAKDSVLRVWDVRRLGAVRALRAPHFTLGSVGSMGRAKAHAEMSPDGRWVAAGAADGGVFVWDLGVQQQQGTQTQQQGTQTQQPPAVTVLRHHKEPAIAAGWSCDAAELVTVDKGGVLAFWRLSE